MNPNILHWSYRDFREFPEELIEHRGDLEEIYLKENFIPTLPLWLFEFIHLKFIHLSGNLLTVLPDEICYLDNLEYLNVSKNQIKALPKTIKNLKKLQYLNASDNMIECIDAEIGSLPALETLDLCRNRLHDIPIQLANSTTICELFFSENSLCEIPAKVMSMPQLKVFEAERCSLEYLPGLIGNEVTHIRIFNNTRLTHYPIVYEKFLRLHYDYWSENVVSADLLMIFLPDESKRTIIPRGIRKLSTSSDPRIPSTLYEISLRHLYSNHYVYNSICRKLANDSLPMEIFNYVQQGPVTVCGSLTCSTPLFTECIFSLLKKNQSASHIIFSNMFCSMDCSHRWHEDNKARYHSIDWTAFV